MNELASSNGSIEQEAVGSDEVQGGPWIPASSVAAATWALFLGLGLVMVGNGLNASVLGVRSEAEGFGLGVTGLIMASYFVGFLAGSSYTEHALKKVGHIRVFAALASGASSVVLIQALLVNPVTWAAMRFLFGACMAGIYVVVESWLNDLATNETRGRILSVYMMVTMAGIGAGQLLLNVEDSSGFRLFIFVSVLVSLSLVPVTLSATSSPPLAIPEHMGFRELLRFVPTGVVVAFWDGAATGALFGMGAVYASNVGMSAARISIFLTAPLVGAVLFQWPIGWLSDRFPRRAIMFGLTVTGAAAATVPLLVEDGSSVAIVAMAVLGAALLPLYSLTIAYTNDWLTAEQILGASATLVRTNGAGAVVGPLVAGALMALFEARFFFWSMAGALVIIGCYLLYRIVVKDSLPIERQRDYVTFPARASAMAANLIPRRRLGSGSAPTNREQKTD